MTDLTKGERLTLIARYVATSGSVDVVKRMLAQPDYQGQNPDSLRAVLQEYTEQLKRTEEVLNQAMGVTTEEERQDALDAWMSDITNEDVIGLLKRLL